MGSMFVFELTPYNYNYLTMKIYLDLAVKAALLAGEEIIKIYNDENSDFNIEIKADNSPLTIADKMSNEVICKELNTSCLPILSEEIKNNPYSERKEWDSLWIVDPLDGTKEFIKRNGEFTVNIALVKNGTPILGVIYIPVKKILYFGAKSEGAYKIEDFTIENYNGIGPLIKASMTMPCYSQEREFRVVASRSHLSPETKEFINKKKEQFPNLEMVSVGSSIKICLVCEGSADVYPRFAPTMEWDTAAGDAIARSMGLCCTLTDESTPLKYNKENLLNPWFIIKK